MSRLVNAEEVKARISQYWSTRSTSIITLPALRKVVDDTPSVDVLDQARAIKEYCDNKRVNCANCPFYNRERELSCVLRDPCMSWDLPKGDDE